MPAFKPQMVKVLALTGFIARPGHAARPGEIVSVTPAVANTAIACGQARLPTAEDDPLAGEGEQEISNLDPSPTNRDPRGPRRSK